MLQKNSGNTLQMNFPTLIESVDIQRDIKNATNLATNVIRVFLIPQVIPIPKESILEEIARIK